MTDHTRDDSSIPGQGYELPSDHGSAEGIHPNDLQPDGHLQSQHPKGPQAGATTPHVGHRLDEEEAFQPVRFYSRRCRKRQELEARFGKSPLYFELKAYGILGVYLDRDFASTAGIVPRDRLTFGSDTAVPNRFSLAKRNHGWQVRELSYKSDLLYMSPKIATPCHRKFQSFVFDADGAVTPTEVKITEEDGLTFIDFTLPNILPPAVLQGQPLILTRAYRRTIVNLDQSLAAEADIRPGNPLKLGYDPEQYPEELLIFRGSDQVFEEYTIQVNDRWLHHCWDLYDFNSSIFPDGEIHLTPSVKVGDYTISPDRPPLKVLVMTVQPRQGRTWADLGRQFFKPYYQGSSVAEEAKPSGNAGEQSSVVLEPVSLGYDTGVEINSDEDLEATEASRDGAQTPVTIPSEASET